LGENSYNEDEKSGTIENEIIRLRRKGAVKKESETIRKEGKTKESENRNKNWNEKESEGEKIIFSRENAAKNILQGGYQICFDTML
jgi:hypothetical protein